MTTTETGVDKLVYSVSEVAELLGISRGSAYTYVRNGHIRSVNIGGRFIIPKQAVDEFLTIGNEVS